MSPPQVKPKTGLGWPAAATDRAGTATYTPVQADRQTDREADTEGEKVRRASSSVK